MEGRVYDDDKKTALPKMVKEVPDRIMKSMKSIRGPKFLKQLKFMRNQRVDKLVRERAIKLRQQWRKIVTGDEQKRIRDYVNDFGGSPKYIKFFDKISFTYGILNIVACEYFLLKSPTFFWLWYLLAFPMMLVARVVHFKGMDLEYFLLDFCYFVCTASIVDLLIFSQSQYLFKSIFIYANGPLLWAIIIWRNSMVFHDFDKMTSVYIHLLPSMLTYVARAHGHYMCLGKLQTLIGLGECTANQLITFTSPMTLWDYGVAAGGYILWQSGYFVQTEIIDKKKLDDNPQKSTSLRWIAQDTKNKFARMILGWYRKIGVFGPKEDFDAGTAKTKAAFIFTQFVYTIVTFLPSYLLYYYPTFHLSYIVIVFAISVYYGASFYIEVFATRYAKSLEKLELQNAAMATMNAALSDALLANASVSAGGKKPETIEEEETQEEETQPSSSATTQQEDGSSEASGFAKRSSGSLAGSDIGSDIQYDDDIDNDYDRGRFHSTEELIDDILSQLAEGYVDRDRANSSFDLTNIAVDLDT